MQSSENVEPEDHKLVLKEDTDIFHLLDSADEQQIMMEAQDRMKDALVYKMKRYVEGKGWIDESQLSYAGIQHITIMMAAKKDSVGALALVEDPKIEMKTYPVTLDQGDKIIQKWYASCKVRNTLSGMITPGVAEADVVIKVPKRDPDTNKKIWNEEKRSYEMVDGYDDFGRNKAISKAFRNACKIQIPQKLILEMIKIAEEKGQTKNVETETADGTYQKGKLCNCEEKEMKPQTKSDFTCHRCGGDVAH